MEGLVNTTRLCCRCGTDDQTQFSPATLLSKQKHKWCISCRRDYDFQAKYHITLAEYNRKFNEQGGVCAICKEPPKSDYKQYRLYVDHNHKTRKVRELLCRRCNFLVAGIENKSKVIRLIAKCVQYIRKHREA